MMTSALQFLQEEECRHRELRPPQLQMLLDALSLVGLRTNAPEHMWFLQIVESRLNEFPLPLLTSTLARLQLLQPKPTDLLIAATERFREVDISFPTQKASQKDGVETVELSLPQWVRLVNSAEPMSFAEGPKDWTVEQIAEPFVYWLGGFLEDFGQETNLLSRALAFAELEEDDTRRMLLRESAVARYKAQLQVVDCLGPRFTICLALHGLKFVADAPSELQEPVWERRREEPAALEARLRFGGHSTGCEQTVVFQHFAVAKEAEAKAKSNASSSHALEKLGPGEEGEEEDEEEEAEEEEPAGKAGTKKPQKELERGKLLAFDFARENAEFKVLSRLARDLLERDVEGDVFGDVTIFTERPPSLSCLGAMMQLRNQWPNLSIHVGYAGLPAAWPEINRPTVEESGEALVRPMALEEAVCCALRGSASQSLAVALLGTDPRVRELWKSICQTGVRPSGKNVPGKKREWQDKLKYFLAHRPHAFQLDGEKLSVRLVEEPNLDQQERVSKFNKLRAAVEETILELLRCEKTSRDHRGGGGYVLIEDVACTPRVYTLWQKLRWDSSDRLAFYLQHTEAPTQLAA
ncbi:Uncharacterized protein SCF082_LOCUS28465 [Durusdinium trenchii]|uniref:Uncharacterized protein n=1 Tax=Durusdinium trenchii TaxID=1381693 RepID=A0ABP0ML72_9DINO